MVNKKLLWVIVIIALLILVIFGKQLGLFAVIPANPIPTELAPVLFITQDFAKINSPYEFYMSSQLRFINEPRSAIHAVYLNEENIPACRLHQQYSISSEAPIYTCKIDGSRINKLGLNTIEFVYLGGGKVIECCLNSGRNVFNQLQSNPYITNYHETCLDIPENSAYIPQFNPAPKPWNTAGCGVSDAFLRSFPPNFNTGLDSSKVAVVKLTFTVLSEQVFDKINKTETITPPPIEPPIEKDIFAGSILFYIIVIILIILITWLIFKKK